MVVTNDQGISFDVADVLAVQYTNAQGLFMAMISSILSGEIYIRLVKGGKMKISLPETVPSNVANAFNVLIPGVVTIFIISGIGLLFNEVFGYSFYDAIAKWIQAPLTGGFNWFTRLFVIVLGIYITMGLLVFMVHRL